MPSCSSAADPGERPSHSGALLLALHVEVHMHLAFHFGLVSVALSLPFFETEFHVVQAGFGLAM